jgi:hypothetical protein
MKHTLLMLCVLPIAAILSGCAGGPTVSVALGYGGVQGNISWTPPPKPSPTLDEAGAAFRTLTGKSPISAAP